MTSQVTARQRSALVADEAGRLVDLVLRAGGRDDVGAGVGEGDGHRAAEAAPGAGDDGDFAVEAKLVEDAHRSVDCPDLVYFCTFLVSPNFESRHSSAAFRPLSFARW